MRIRLLAQEDWAIWKELRLEALKNSPTSFGSSFEEESIYVNSKFQEILNNNNIFGAFIENELVGSVSFYSLNLQKMKHRGYI